jgi:hypothetical protein
VSVVVIQRAPGDRVEIVWLEFLVRHR